MGRITAQFQEAAAWDSITCHLCPQLCSIAPQRTGRCGYRINRNGELYSDLYETVALERLVDADTLPIFTWHPEFQWYLIGFKGCTMHCPFCNTARYSQLGGTPGQPRKAAELIEAALKAKADGITFGVGEPTLAFEFLQEVLKLARETSLKTHIATSGHVNPGPLRSLLPLLDAVTVGIKIIDSTKTSETLGADWDTIHQNLKILARSSTHLEVTWLPVPELSEGEENFTGLLSLLRDLDRDIPVMILPYTPEFIWASKEASCNPPTEIDLWIERAMKTYPSPIFFTHPDSLYRDTRCPSCRRTLVRRGEARQFLATDAAGCPSKRCPHCNAPLPYRIS